MAQYIEKDALMAEIEKKTHGEQGYSSGDAECGYRDCAREILSFIDTLEVKEVDLEKESEIIANEIMIEVQSNRYHTNIYNTERNDFNHSHLWLAARKGIELGLSKF